MCFLYTSIDQASGICPMCSVFKPSGAKCPHIRDVCQNRSLHPKYDVIHLKNAEVQTFNGCGYCKFARKMTTPSSRSPVLQNTGWPGCCRPPTIAEQRLIPAADWPAVSAVHRVPLPADVKALLDSISAKGSSVPRVATSLPSNSKITVKGSPTTKVGATVKSSTSPAKKSGGSPVSAEKALTSPLSKSQHSSPASSPKPDFVEVKQLRSTRTSPDGSPILRSSSSSPPRKVAEVDADTTPVRSTRRDTVTASNSSNYPLRAPQLPIDTSRQPSPLRDLPLNSPSGTVRLNKSISPPSTRIEAPTRFSTPQIQPKRPTLEVAMSGLRLNTTPAVDAPPISSVPSSASSSDSGSRSDSTITSEGGFTDYLSDESEAELQRQAEARAVLLAQNLAEEAEFRAARERLAQVDLRPPKSWGSPAQPATSV